MCVAKKAQAKVPGVEASCSTGRRLARCRNPIGGGSDIDPLKIARDLWEQSLGHAAEAALSTAVVERGNEPQGSVASEFPQANHPEAS